MDIKEIENFLENKRPKRYIILLTATAILLGFFWFSFAISTIILSGIYREEVKEINTSVVLIPNAVFLILFISNVIMLGLLWRKDSKREKYNREIKEKALFGYEYKLKYEYKYKSDEEKKKAGSNKATQKEEKKETQKK